jgi:ketosteroid isomerase-like protein
VEVVRSGVTVLSEPGLTGAAEFWHPAINYRAIEGAPDDVGEMNGIEAVLRYVQDWFGTFDDFKSEPEELLDMGGDQVVAVVHISGRAKSSGIPTELRYAALYTIRDGKMARVREYATRAEALKAAGLEE